MRRILVSAVVLLTLVGCSTAVQKTYQEVHVSTPGVEGAECLLETEKQKHIAITPQTIILDRAPYNLLVTCKKAYYHDAVVKVDYKIKPWYGMMFPPGLVYDTADNSVYGYPDHIQVEMQEDAEALAERQKMFDAPKSEVRKKVKEEEFSSAAPEITSQGEKTFDGSLHK